MLNFDNIKPKSPTMMKKPSWENQYGDSNTTDFETRNAEIRSRVSNNEINRKQAAKEYNLAFNTVCRICAGLGSDARNKDIRDSIAECKRLRGKPNFKTFEEISEIMELSISTVRAYCYRKDDGSPKTNY